ncbi:MAG: HRDC domain-containing protein [Limisphaera sp.]|nr:HRDC domain-containing protein [Limisphaera sp.]
MALGGLFFILRRVIDSPEALEAFLPVLRAAPWVSMDTEADSLHAYPEKLCLIQISTPTGDRLIDPLAGLDLTPLLQVLAGHNLIMHGADYDLRLLWRYNRFVPGSVFDTMLAARFLGERNFSLSALLERYLGVSLDKSMQKADWSRRPLTPRMESYARNDTRHLKPLSDRLRSELVAKGRLAWHEEACHRLIQECTCDPVVDLDQVWRVKGSHLLSRRGLAVLRELWLWREAEARASNRPPFFILPHETLSRIAAAAVDSTPVDQWLPPRFPARRRAGLKEAIARGLATPPDQWPELRRGSGRRLTEAEQARLEALEARRNQRARELGLDPSFLAPRSVLIDLARDWDTHAPRLMSWQRELLES